MAGKRTKVEFVCRECGETSARWLGKCPSCNAWSSFAEHVVTPATKRAAAAPASSGSFGVVALGDVRAQDATRIPTGLSELDRALGGGVVSGGIILLGGDPGIGKSTLLLQTLASLERDGHRTLYISGEESAAQVALRAERLEVKGTEKIRILATNELETARAALEAENPVVAVVDSIQTMRSGELELSSGSATLLRAVTEQLVELGKQKGIALFLIGHVTKEGTIAGPKVLEHLVDTVLAFEGDRSHAFRIVRATKNRFGPAQEIGVFEMVRDGLREVPEPSAMFLAERPANAAGSVVVPTAEGSRPLLVEVQALVSPSAFGSARRTVSGLDSNRLAILLAVLERKVGIHVLDQDVFASIAGGARIDERALDLALAVAVVSSFRNMPIRAEVAVFGEVGLAGEVRAVPRPGQRIIEARRLGFRRILLPALNLETLSPSERAGCELVGVRNVAEALELALS